MIDQSRRGFFKTILTAGAALAASGVATRPRAAEASQCGVKGICLFVPTLGKASDFVALMNESAPGHWTAHPLTGTVTDYYFTTKSLYQEAREKTNTFVGVVDPATFAVVHEAIVDSGGSFHYVRYEERDRVTFSAQV